MNLDDTARRIAAMRALPPAARAARNRALLDRPPLIDLELASACNVVCTFCPRGQMRRREGLMSEATFAAVETLLPTDAVVMISGLGDALLHPHLPEWVARLVARGISTCVITNGVRLTPERQTALIQAGISQIQISIHGLDDHTVRSVMPRGARPSLVVQHIESLARIRPAHLRVRLNFVETATNTHAREEVQALAERLGLDFFYRREHMRGGSLGAGRAAARDEGCGIFGAVTFISADGDVLPCVNDVEGESALGNVRTLSWTDIRAWKRAVIDDGTWFPACAGCDDDYRWVILAQGEVDEQPPE